VVGDLVLQAGIELRIGVGLTFENDGAAVRHDQAVPDQQRPGLTAGHLGVVLAVCNIMVAKALIFLRPL
jgi:hypothetical protein